MSSYEVSHQHLASISQNTANINTWSGKNCIVDFLRNIDETAQLQHRYDSKMTRLGINLTAQQQKDFETCTHCPRCDTKFDEAAHKKVRDHDHITGKFRSALSQMQHTPLSLTAHTSSHFSQFQKL